MWLIRASLQNAYMVATLVFMLLALGVVALTSIPIDILPVFKSPAVQVLTYYQGMPASSVEKTITNRIERWTNQAPGAARVESKSVPGVSVVKIFFRDDIDPNAALTMTNSLALGTLPTLPPNTLPPVVLPFDPTGTCRWASSPSATPARRGRRQGLRPHRRAQHARRRARLRGPRGGRRQGPHHPHLPQAQGDGGPQRLAARRGRAPSRRAT